MPFVKESVCSVCKKQYFWKIERPGDGYWDRWQSDDGDILANWFLANHLCWDHAFQNMPVQFRKRIRTVAYEETDASGDSAGAV